MTDKIDELVARVEILEKKLDTVVRESDTEFAIFQMTTTFLMLSVAINAQPYDMERMLREFLLFSVDQPVRKDRIIQFFSDRLEFVMQMNQRAEESLARDRKK